MNLTTPSQRGGRNNNSSPKKLLRKNTVDFISQKSIIDQAEAEEKIKNVLLEDLNEKFMNKLNT